MKRTPIAGAAVVISLMLASSVLAHVTPPKVLLTDQQALSALLPGAEKITVRDVRLSADARRAIQQQVHWAPSATPYKFHEGRTADNRLIGTVIFLSQASIHGPVKVAVAVDPTGKLMGAVVASVSEECYQWVKPLADQDFARPYVGQDGRGTFAPADQSATGGKASMVKFYAKTLAAVLQHGVVLHQYGSTS